MSEHGSRRKPRPGRARKRAIRAQAALTGVAYSVAARQLEAVGLRPGETISSYGRTIYPAGHDSYRQQIIERRARRSFDERLADTRRAAVLPGGRAQHLVERFPPTRGAQGSKVGPLYHGEGREELITMLYLTVAAESPGLVPAVGDLAWVAEMGEETALDMACAELDRDARAMLDRDPVQLWPQIEATLARTAQSPDWRLRQEATRLSALYRALRTPRLGIDGEPYVDDLPLDGARQILDAVLIVADDGHAPGTRVRVLAQEHEKAEGTIIGALWGPAGPPIAYRVTLDDSTLTFDAETDKLVVLPGQGSVAR